MGYHLFFGGSGLGISNGVFVQLWDIADLFWNRFCAGGSRLSCGFWDGRFPWRDESDLENTPKNNTTMCSKL